MKLTESEGGSLQALNALRLTIDFFVIVIGGLLASYILGVLLSAGVYDVVVDHEDLVNWRLPPHDIQLLEKGRVVGLVKEYSLFGNFVLLLLAANLLRIVHSFFILSKNLNYNRLFLEEGLVPDAKRRLLVVMQLIGQVTVVFIGFAGLTWLDAEQIWIAGLGILFGLLLYDLSTFLILRSVPGWIEKRLGKAAAGAIKICYQELEDTFLRWSIIDGGAVVVAALFLIIEAMNPTTSAVFQAVTGLILLAVLVVDYVILNRSFYWHEMLAPPSKLKEVESL